MAQRRTLPSAPRVTIEVTAEEIKNSTKKDSSSCMIANSIKRCIPGASYAAADIQTLRFTKDGFRFSYITPRRVQIALIRFDAGDETIEPFTFQLRTGQTTRAGSRKAVKTGKPQPRTEKQQAATKRAMAQSTKGFDTGKDNVTAFLEGVRPDRKPKVKLVTGSGRNGTVPEIRGGRTAPLAQLAGGEGVHSNIPGYRRRAFGLRAMDKWVAAAKDGQEEK